MTNRRVIISLMGGLGNQLFQYAYALKLSRKADAGLMVLFENVRLNKDGNPEIYSLNIPEGTLIDDFHLPLSSFNKRLMGLVLRLSAQNRCALFVLAISRMLSTRLGWSVAFARGIGNWNIPIHSSKSIIVVGYFQTSLNASDPFVFQKLMELRPKSIDSFFVQQVEEVKQLKPYLVHVRLTDYAQEDSIGIPTLQYYQNSIEFLFEKTGPRQIWVFSDDIDLAVKYLPKDFSNYYFFVQPLISTSMNFELMRHFSGYVIANSSFSWWAAFLRYDQSCVVCAPDPWFKSGRFPADLLPKEWIRVLSFNRSLD